MSTVYEDVAFAPRNYGLPEAEVDRRVMNALEMTGITHLKDKQIYKMSGGEKKLASIATILSMTPDIILMDEPSIALDPRNRRKLIHILNSFEHLKIIASHDLDMILDTCSRTILMAEGRIICDGPTKEVLSNRELLENNGLELPLSIQK
jgi:cobalt/nickel transport system ATP-binding protein